MELRDRNKPTEKIRGVKATDITYNEQAGAVKVLGPILGSLINLGAAPVASTAFTSPVKNGSILAFFNNSGSVAFIQTSDAAIAAAPIATTGICLPPYAYTFIALKDRDAFIRSSSADVIMYYVEDYSFIQ